MLDKNVNIYVTGQSVLASFVSIKLAQKNIWHTFNHDDIDLNALKPTSNQLINAESQELEMPFILDEYKGNIPTFTNAEVFFYGKDLSYRTKFSGNYKNPIYAIDNRIRIKSFDNKIKENALLKLMSLGNGSSMENCSTILVLGGSQYYNQFETIDLPVSNRKVANRCVVSLNLMVDSILLTEFNGTFSFMLEGIGEVICYPFLHVSNKKGVCVVINYACDSIFNVLHECKTSSAILKELDKIFENKVALLSRLFKNAVIFEEYFLKGLVVSYFKCPAIEKNQQLVIGVGSAIMNTDPIVGQGYNLGLKLSSQVVDSIEMESVNNGKLKELINQYSITKLTQMQKLTDIFTNGNHSNPSLGLLVNEMIRNTKLSSFWFEGIEDIAHYFPWIENEEETQKIIADYSK
jgi:hypothetical protein